MSGSQRSEKVHIFSSSEFNARVGSDDEEVSEFLKLQISREDLNSNDYTLTLSIPSDVDRDFETTVVLTHPYTKFEKVLPVSFVYTQPKEKQTRKTPVKQQEPDYEEMPKQRKSDYKGSGGGFGNYLAMFLVLAVTIAFVAQNWLGVNVTVSNSFLFKQFQGFFKN